ncbi:MAG TPA: hypothetical protein GX729_05225 [Firmicutes bacterium]|nr:hypothetical protein [Bacillota bacterium]
MSSANIVTIACIGLQVIVAVAGIALCAQPLRVLGGHVKRIKDRVEEPDANQLLSLGIESLCEADYLFEGHGALSKCWEDYKLAVRSDSRHLPDPVPFFPYQHIIAGPGHRRLAEMLPGVFTGLGILGTFLGLVLGLRGMSVQDAAAIKNSISALISGMHTAFWTSITGLVFSLAWSGVDRGLLHKAEDDLSTLHSILTRLVPGEDEWDLLGKMTASQQEQLATFKALATDTLIPEMIAGIRQAFDEALAPHLNQTTQVFSQFANFTADRHIEGIDEITDKILSGFMGAFDTEIGTLSEQMKSMADWQGTVSTDLQNLSQSLVQAAREQQDAFQASSKFVESLEKQATLLEQFEHTLIKVQTEIETGIELLSTVFSDFAKLSETLQQETIHYAEVYERQSQERERQIAMLQEQLREMKLFWDGALSQVRQIQEDMIAGSQAFGRELTQGLEYTFQQYDKFLAESVQRLRVVVSAMSEAVQDLPDEMGQIGRNLRTLNETVRTVTNETKEWAVNAAATEGSEGVGS